MLDLKRRLGALIPGDARKIHLFTRFQLMSYMQNARGALQNVLTVEWSGHKTVLVEVPSASGSSPSNDVELTGMGINGRDHNNYGRLIDDDDESLYLSQSEKPSSRERRSSKSQKSLPALPDRPTQPRVQSNNPFYSPDELEDFQSSYKPIYTSSQSYEAQSTSRRPANVSSFSDVSRSPPTRTWAKFGANSTKSVDPWSGSGRNTVNSTSPTSSRGTTSPGTREAGEDPFQ